MIASNMRDLRPTFLPIVRLIIYVVGDSLGLCPQSCSGNGFCVNGTCKCQGGWSGISCSQNPQVQLQRKIQ